MIIWGTRGVTTTKRTGSFFCPKCQRDQSYAQKRLRRFFTLYFIPLIPMDLVAEYVQCGACSGQFRMEVLSLDPRKQAQQLSDSMNTVVAGAMIRGAAAAGVRDGQALESLRQALARGGVEVNHGDLRSRLGED